MKRKSFHYIYVVFLVGIFSFFVLNQTAKADFLEEFEVGLQGGYRLDDLDWNIASDFAGSTPNILSELSWSDLETYQVSTNGQLVSGNKNFPVLMKLRWDFGYGFIFGGDNQDSDYFGDNRTLEFSRSNNNSDDGSMIDATVGVGPHFYSANKRFNLSILFGYSYHEQNLTMTDGNQTIDTVVPFQLGIFSGLDSSYETQWWGPWLGVDLEVKPTDKLTIASFFEFHFAEYEAKANWNLRSDFAHPVSFEHWGDGDYGPSDGYGIVVGLNFGVNISKFWAVNIGAKYQQWKVENGIDRVYWSDGTPPSDTRLNEVNWKSLSAALGLTYRFL
jgi:hypothetical protein